MFMFANAAQGKTVAFDDETQDSNKTAF